MDECFRCCISGGKTKLLDAISKEGIVKICKECFSKENLPIIKKTVFSENEESQPKSPPENFLSQIPREKKKPKENESWLIDNFHWAVMRVRRSKHITQKQFAKAIGESETIIKDIEKGLIAKYNFQLINKIENYLGIKLLKISNNPKKQPENKPIQEAYSRNPVKLDPEFYDNLTISDLQKIKKEYEIKHLEKSQKEEDSNELDLEENKKEKLSLWDIGKIIFKGK